MKLVSLDDLPADCDFREQWDDLVYRVENPQVFYTWEWAQAVCTAYGRNLRLLLLLGYRANRLVGIAPLTLSGDREVSFLTAATADYCDFISVPEDRAEMLQLSMAELRRMKIKRLRLANLPAESLTMEYLRSTARESGFFTFARPAYFCRQITLVSSEQRAQAKKSAWNTGKRKAKTLRATGRCEVAHASNWGDFADDYQKFASAHIGRFLAEGRISNLVSRERRSFLEELGRLLGEKGWLAISGVRLNGKSVAWNYGMKFGTTWFWYQPALDHGHRQSAPGTYLLCEIIQRAAEDETSQSVDLGLGDEPYKQRYANTGRKTLQVIADASVFRTAAEILRHYSASLIKKSSKLERLLRNGVARIRTTGSYDSFLRRSGAFLLRTLFGHAEVIFFQHTRSHSPGSNATGFSPHTLLPLTLDLLADAAMEYEHDASTIQYLLRCADRLNRGGNGFVLLDSRGIPVNFAWAAPFERFWVQEIGRHIDAPVSDSYVIFDCWTPAQERGRGNYSQALRMIATQVYLDGKTPWIYSAATNRESIRGIERADFSARFSITRSTTLGLLHTWRQTDRVQNRLDRSFSPAA